MAVIGIDIGGTKCTVCSGKAAEERIQILHNCKSRKTKDYTVQKMMEGILEDVLYCMELLNGIEEINGIGISCGGPLDSKDGIILSPPNLPGWDNIHIKEFLEKRTGIKTWLLNDANACALAEWKLGAGRGCSNMIFMTFGTGLGAGIILNNRLYTGASDMAGEIGHIRLSDYGPSGYGKMGSFEGFCSGGGIAQLAKLMVLKELQMGRKPELCSTVYDLESITAEKVGNAAKSGDKLAIEILKITGIQLGKGLSILIDIMNPERIVIGSIFNRCYDEIWPWASQIVDTEVIPIAKDACSIVPGQLTENAGNYASLIAAEYSMDLERNR